LSVNSSTPPLTAPGAYIHSDIYIYRYIDIYRYIQADIDIDIDT
jgi:hypothetical protein